MDWKNKVAVITGASSGIGKATKDLLRNKGCIVYNLDLKRPKEEDDYLIFCDVSKKESINAAIEKVFTNEKKIDLVFANAGVHLFATLEETTYEQLESIVAINVLGIFYLLKKVIPIMKDKRKGSIVLMGSDQSFIGKASSSVYGMTKGAIGQLAKSMAIDYAPYNIRVNCICPGTIDTPLLHRAVDHFASVTAAKKEDVYTSLNSIQPLGRIGKAEEIASAVAYILSDENSFMTGSLVSVDGGYVCQ